MANLLSGGLPALNTDYGPDWGKVAAVAQLSMQQNLLKRKIVDEDATKAAMSGYTPGSGVNQEAVTNLLRVNPELGVKIIGAESTFDKKNPEMAAQKLKNAQAAIDLAIKQAPLLKNNPAAYPAFQQQMTTVFGVDPQILPPDLHTRPLDQYNAAIGHLEEAGMKMSDRLAAQTPKEITYQQGGEKVSELMYPGGRREPLGRGPQWDPDKQGMETILPDGTTVRVGGSKQGGPTGLQKPTQNKVEEDLLKATDVLKNTIRIRDSFKPEFSTFGGQLKGEWLSLKSKLAEGSISNDESKYLDEFVNFRAEAGQVFSQSLKDLSGVAVNPTEYKRAEAFLINPGSGVFDGDSPAKVKSKTERMIDFQRKAIARLNYVRRYGMSIRDIELDKMDSIIQKRAGQIEKQMEPYFPGKENQAQLIERTKQTLAEEFGLTY